MLAFGAFKSSQNPLTRLPSPLLPDLKAFMTSEKLVVPPKPSLMVNSSVPLTVAAGAAPGLAVMGATGTTAGARMPKVLLVTDLAVVGELKAVNPWLSISFPNFQSGF
jgi:hypothetical protein